MPDISDLFVRSFPAEGRRDFSTGEVEIAS
jgi:hypothetical protein